MNTIEEILKKKYTIKEETLYQTYSREVCKVCKNNPCEEELRIKIDGTIKCDSFEKCMTNKCKTCNKEKECFEEVKE